MDGTLTTSERNHSALPYPTSRVNPEGYSIAGVYSPIGESSSFKMLLHKNQPVASDESGPRHRARIMSLEAAFFIISMLYDLDSQKQDIQAAIYPV
jgi:hypothetical protein